MPKIKFIETSQKQYLIKSTHKWLNSSPVLAKCVIFFNNIIVENNSFCF